VLFEVLEGCLEGVWVLLRGSLRESLRVVCV